MSDGAGTGDVPMRTGHVRGIAGGSFHRIAYTDWGDGASAKVAICVHGLSRQGRDFDPLARALVREGWRVVCPDLPGRGRSDWLKDPEDYSLAQYVVDMTVLVAHLGAEGVDWVGTSLGGLIGMMMASKQGTPVRSLVINDIGPFLSWQPMLSHGTNVRAAPRSHQTFASALQHLSRVHRAFGPLTEAQWEHLARHSFFQDARGAWVPHFDPGIAQSLRIGRVFNVSFWAQWNAVACPTLVLRGEFSELLSENTAAEMTRSGPRAKLVEVRGCGHAPALLDPDQIEVVVSWMRSAT